MKINYLFTTYVYYIWLSNIVCLKKQIIEHAQITIVWYGRHFEKNNNFEIIKSNKPLWIACSLNQSESTFYIWVAPRVFDEFSQTELPSVFRLYTGYFLGENLNVSCRVVPCGVVSCRVVSCRVVSCCVVLCCVRLCLNNTIERDWILLEFSYKKFRLNSSTTSYWSDSPKIKPMFHKKMAYGRTWHYRRKMIRWCQLYGIHVSLAI